jgi:hypothetical protein
MVNQANSVRAAVAGLFLIVALFTSQDVAAQSESSAQGCNDLLQLASSMGRAADSVFINQEVCDAYRFLLERNGTGTRGTQCYRSQTDRILKLNPQFAVGLAKALAEIEKLYGGRNIVQSGYRCDGTNGNHTRGCAADIIWRSCQKNTRGHANPWRCSSDTFDSPEQKWIDANGRNAPYNIQLRLRFAPEGHHVEPTNTQGCITGPMVSGSGAAPSAGFTESLRQWLAPQQQVQATPSQPAISSQPVSISQNPLGAFDIEPQPAEPTAVSSQINPTAHSSSSTAADRLEELAFGPKPATSTTATSVPLVVSGSNAAMLVGTQQASTTAVTSSQGVISPSQTTFVSGDLSWQDPTISSAPVSGVQAILITIRAALNRMLQYLVPFNTETHTDEHEYDDY